MRSVIVCKLTVNKRLPAPSYQLVRGHFATYTQERPLFGRYAGTVFIPAHVRGTPEAGIVIKDYALAETAATAID